MDIAIVQTVRVPYHKDARQNVVRGIVRDVPPRTTLAEVRDKLTEAGQAPTEAGIAWANHQVRKLKDHEALTDAAGLIPVKEWRWADLESPKRVQLNVRLSPRLLADCRRQAQAQGRNLNDWVEAALTAATGQD